MNSTLKGYREGTELELEPDLELELEQLLRWAWSLLVCYEGYRH